MADKCRACDASIRWAVTSKGRRMPLDRLPSTTGNVVVDVTADGVVAIVLGGLELAAAQGDGTVLYMPHHATCPQAERFRRRPGGSRGRRGVERRGG